MKSLNRALTIALLASAISAFPADKHDDRGYVPPVIPSLSTSSRSDSILDPHTLGTVGIGIGLDDTNAGMELHDIRSVSTERNNPTPSQGPTRAQQKADCVQDALYTAPRALLLLGTASAQIAALSLLREAATATGFFPDEYYQADAILGTTCNAIALGTAYYGLTKYNEKIVPQLKKLYKEEPELLAIMGATAISQIASCGQFAEMAGNKGLSDNLYYTDAGITTGINSLSALSYANKKTGALEKIGNGFKWLGNKVKQGFTACRGSRTAAPSNV